jgi:hypothetical protein
MSLPRRVLLTGFTAGLASHADTVTANTAQPVAGPDLTFRVLRNDSQIGTHALRFTVETRALTVRIATQIRVGLGPITFYRYTHRAEERWQDGLFVALDAETDDNGAVTPIRVRRDEAGFSVTGGQAPRGLAPENALPLTHWNRAMLDGPMISGQSGALLRPVVGRLGADQVTTAAGGVIEADRYTLRGDPDMDTWYDARATWRGLRLTARDGSIIRYEPA